MSYRKQILSGSWQLTLSQIIVQGAALVRNVIIGRFISPADFGIAATFAITLTLVESISDLGLDKLIIQSEKGDDARFRGTLHLLLALRGAIIGLFFVLVGWPVAELFGVPQAAWAFRCLALAPLLKGFLNLDIYGVQRQMNFMPMAKVEVAAGVISTLVAWPLVHWLRDYSAMLWISLLQPAITVVFSHLLAKDAYRWRWEPAAGRQALKFGGPLLVNGFLLFLVFQGDRFIIGSANRLFHHSYYSLADLGVYSVAVTLTVIPTGILAKVCTSIFLPLFSRPQKDSSDFSKVYASCSQTCAVLSGLAALPFVLLGGWLVVMVYGPNYAAASRVIGLLALSQALRVTRITPTLIAMSKGDTTNAMLSNLWRLGSILGVCAVASQGASMAWIAAMGVVGEALALTVAVWHLRRRHGVAAGLCLKPLLGVALLICVAVAALPLLAGMPTFLRVLGAILLSVCYLIGACIALPVFRHLLFAISGDLTTRWRRASTVSPL
jgi:O-antigen/teichoic acid export membrane protein